MLHLLIQMHKTQSIKIAYVAVSRISLYCAWIGCNVCKIDTWVLLSDLHFPTMYLISEAIMGNMHQFGASMKFGNCSIQKSDAKGQMIVIG